ncbi:unnamed protein product [Owenia fusiformis]|uniref:PRA1 family protein n=1 Tax=Owenia fusiformis TaxID=6347 RepID=A0A8J1XGF8_OWEFU|nr:unnamed protein product [Owenia fusiformis]
MTTLKLAPFRSLEDFATDTARFESPEFTNTEKWGNRVLNNLLYYQTNYFLILTILVSIVGLVYPWCLIWGVISVGAAFGAYIFTVHPAPTLQNLRRDYPYGSLVLIVIAAIVLFTSVWNVIGLMVTIFIPTLGCLIHASYRLRSLKNKMFNKLDQGHNTPMVLLLQTLGLKVKGLAVPPELRTKIDENYESTKHSMDEAEDEVNTTSQGVTDALDKVRSAISEGADKIKEAME